MARSAALAHAASVSHQRRRQSQQERTRKKPTLIDSQPLVLENDDDSTSPTSDHEVASSSTASPESPDSVDSEDVQLVRWQESRRLSSDPGKTPRTFIPRDSLGLRGDPFDCVQGGRALDVSMEMDYLATVMAPGQLPMYKVFNVNNVYNLQTLIPLASPDCLHAGAASVQASLDHLRLPRIGPSRTTLKHLGNAIAGVRRTIDKISSEQEKIGRDDGVFIDGAILLTVMFLAACARGMGDAVAYEAHKRSIVAFVDARGGLDKLVDHDGKVRCALLQWEAFWALNNGPSLFHSNRPSYKPEYPEVPIPRTILHQIMKLPTGFQSLALMRKLALDVIEVLARTSGVEDEYNATGTVVDSGHGFKHKNNRFSDFWEACTCFGAPDEIITVKSEHGDATLVPSPNLQKLIILAVILYCSNAFSSTRAVTSFIASTRMKLMTDLPRKFAATKQDHYSGRGDNLFDIAPDTDVRMERSVLLWIAFVLLDSWRSVNNTLLPQGMEILNLTRNYFTKLSTWTEIEVVLRTFFWNQAFLNRCQIFWQLVS